MLFSQLVLGKISVSYNTCCFKLFSSCFCLFHLTVYIFENVRRLFIIIFCSAINIVQTMYKLMSQR